jgi:hypothetical protein
MGLLNITRDDTTWLMAYVRFLFCYTAGSLSLARLPFLCDFVVIRAEKFPM